MQTTPRTSSTSKTLHNKSRPFYSPQYSALSVMITIFTTYCRTIRSYFHCQEIQLFDRNTDRLLIIIRARSLNIKQQRHFTKPLPSPSTHTTPLTPPKKGVLDPTQKRQQRALKTIRSRLLINDLASNEIPPISPNIVPRRRVRIATLT